MKITTTLFLALSLASCGHLPTNSQGQSYPHWLCIKLKQDYLP